MRPPHWALRLYAESLAQRARRAHARPRETQEALLAHLLRQFRDTEIGRLHDLASVRDAADFARRVPVSEEPFYRPLVERVLETNAPGLVTPGPLKYMARTSGTIAASKHVPFTQDLIRAFKRFETKVVMHTMRDLGDYSLLDGQLLITSGSPKVNTTPQGLTIGYGTGIMTELAPKMAASLVRPTRPVLELTNWEAKIEATVREALPLDIRVMTGVPLFAKPILERLVAYAAEMGLPAPNAQALWPHLKAYCYSGSPIGPHEARLRELLGPDVSFREIYTATESPVAYQHRHGVPGMLLDLEETYLEFQPAGSPLDTPRIGVQEVRVGEPYRLLMTTRGGLCAYRLGDIVEFLSVSPLLIRHLGREHEEISLGFERLQLYQVREALDRAAESQGARVQDFFVGPTDPATGVRAYHWYVEFAVPPADPEAVAAEVDRILAAEHPIYGSMRGGTSVVERARLTVLPARTIERYVLENRQFGQGKFTRLYSRREGVDAVLAAVGLAP